MVDLFYSEAYLDWPCFLDSENHINRKSFTKEITNFSIISLIRFMKTKSQELAYCNSNYGISIKIFFSSDFSYFYIKKKLCHIAA